MTSHNDRQREVPLVVPGLDTPGKLDALDALPIVTQNNQTIEEQTRQLKRKQKRHLQKKQKEKSEEEKAKRKSEEEVKKKTEN